MDGRREKQNLGANGGDGGKGCQLILVCYEKPPQDQLTMHVYRFMVRGCGVLFFVRLDVEDGGGYQIRDRRSSCIHEGGGEERGDQDAVSVLADGCVQGSGERINAGGVGDIGDTWWSDSEKRDSLVTCVG